MIFLQRYWHDSMTTPLAKQKLKFPAAVPIENQAALDWRQKQRKTVLSAACARQTVRPRPSVGRRFAARTLKNVFHVCAALYNVPIPPGVSTNLWCRPQRWRSKKHVPSARNASCSCKGGDYVHGGRCTQWKDTTSPFSPTIIFWISALINTVGKHVRPSTPLAPLSATTICSTISSVDEECSIPILPRVRYRNTVWKQTRDF